MNDKLVYKTKSYVNIFKRHLSFTQITSSTISPRLTSFNLLGLDINECSDGSHICEDVCINTEPGYNCSCSEGSLLSSDLHTCDGIILIFLLEINGTIYFEFYYMLPPY